MAEQSLLIRIGIDPSGAVTGGKVAEGALGGLDNRLKGMNTRFGEGASYGDRLTHSLGRLGSAGRMDAFRMLSSDILIATTNMTGMSQASGLLRTGLFAVQSSLGALLGPLGLAGVAVAGMLVVSMFTKKAEATKKAREELEKNQQAIEKNTSALLHFAGEGERWAVIKLIGKLGALRTELKQNYESFKHTMDGLQLAKTGFIDVELSENYAKEQTAELRMKIDDLSESMRVLDLKTDPIAEHFEKLRMEFQLMNEINLAKLMQPPEIKLPTPQQLKAPKGLEGISNATKGMIELNEEAESSFDKLMNTVRRDKEIEKELTDPDSDSSDDIF